MENLFKKYVDLSKIDGMDEERARCRIREAFIIKDDAVLVLRVALNFVMPVEVEREFREKLAGAISDKITVKINYEYDTDSFIISGEQALRAILSRFFAGIESSVIKSANPEKLSVEDRSIKVPTIGQTAAEYLNVNESKRLSLKINEAFGEKYDVIFVNDEAGCGQVKKAMEEHALREDEKCRNSASAKKNGRAQTTAPAKEDKTRGNGFKTRRGGAKILGTVAGTLTPLSSVAADTGKVTVGGTIFDSDTRAIKNDKSLITLLITDKVTSLMLKFFVKNDYWSEIQGRIKVGDYIEAVGETEWDQYSHCLNLMVKTIEVKELPKRKDDFEGMKRVELHAHTKMSDMDGLNEVSQLVGISAGWGHTAVAITDHGVVQGFPDAAKEGEKNGIKVLFGMEGYVFDDKDRIKKDGTIDHKGTKADPVRTNHIIFIAGTQKGIRNLYKLVSISHLKYFYRKPRLPKSVISSLREGILIGSACEAGEVFRAVRENLPEEKIEEIASFYDYLEIQPLINDRFMINDDRYATVNSEEDLRNINRRIVALADKLGKPVVATTDAHYDEPESAIYRNIIMKGKGFKDAENGEGIYLRTTKEMLEEFSYLGEEDAYRVVVENTNKIAAMVEDDIRPVPTEKCPPRIDGAEETLRNTCFERAYEVYGNPLPEEIQQRLETELNAIIDNGYAVMYVSAQMLVNKSLSDGYLVGSRGSVGSSFAATMAGITEVNPLEPHYICPECKHLEWGDMEKYDCGIDMPEMKCPDCGTVMKKDGFTIPFATFLGFKGNKEPDIDLNFAGEYQAVAHRYVGEIFGEENVFKAGTVGTIAERTAIGFVKKFAEETGREVGSAEIKRLASGCMGVKRTTGQHPGGIVILPDDREIYEFCPIQYPANDAKAGIVTTHFDYHKIDQNLLKLDILGHNVPSMIRQLQDLTGIDPLTVNLSDEKVLSIFNGTETLEIKDPDYKFSHGSFAIPEFGTKFVRDMLDDVKPDKIADLVRISGFSHGEKIWLGNARDYIKDGTATMREVISTRDDIMNYLMLKGIENEMSFKIMEDVRKNRPLKEEQLKVMKEHGVPDWYIDSCIKIQYMFPRAHAVAYVMMSLRMAWYKVHYPVEFYATVFSASIQDFNADIILAGSDKVFERIEEINMMGKNVTAKEKGELTVLEVAYEMYARGFGFADADVEKSKALKFSVEDGKVLLPFAAFNGVGETAARALEEEYEKKPFETIEDAMLRAKIGRSVIDVLKEHGVFGDLPETNQIGWSF